MGGFEITTEGKYFARSGVMGGERVLKDYILVCRLSSMKAALSIIKNKVLSEGLKKKYADYLAYQTHFITKVTPLDDVSVKELAKAEVCYMDRPALLAFIKEHALPVATQYYPSLVSLREAVAFCRDDEEGYLKRFELRKEDLAVDIEVARMNPDIFDKKEGVSEDVVLGSVPVVETGDRVPEKKKRLSAKANAKQAEARVAGLAKDEFADAAQEDDL